MSESFHSLSIELLRSPSDDPFHQAMRLMIIGWAQYAAAYRNRYEVPISDDSELHDPFKKIGLSLMAMLWGDIGELDFAKMERLIKEVIVENGY